jgi:hypothetical protein
MLRGGDTPSNAWSPSARRAAVVRKPPEALSTYAAILAAATMGFGLVALVCGIQMIVSTIGAGHFVWPDAGYFTWAFIEVPFASLGVSLFILINGSRRRARYYWQAGERHYRLLVVAFTVVGLVMAGFAKKEDLSLALGQVFITVAFMALFILMYPWLDRIAARDFDKGLMAECLLQEGR